MQRGNIGACSVRMVLARPEEISIGAGYERASRMRGLRSGSCWQHAAAISLNVPISVTGTSLMDGSITCTPFPGVGLGRQGTLLIIMTTAKRVSAQCCQPTACD